MMTKFVVSDKQKAAFNDEIWYLQRGFREGVLNLDYILEGLQLLNKGYRVEAVKKESVKDSKPKKKKSLLKKKSPNFRQRILDAEMKTHRDRLNQTYDLSEYESRIIYHGKELIDWWKANMYEPHYIPRLPMTEKNNYPCWEKKLDPDYCQWVKDRRILRQNKEGYLIPVEFIGTEGGSFLIDTRLKPNYADGRQMYKKDNLIGSMIKELRENKKITEYEDGPQTSRFGTSADDEWEKRLKIEWAKCLRVKEILSETYPQFNLIAQLYPHMPRGHDGKTDTWVWFDEYFEGRGGRLLGGDFGGGGLADVGCSSSGNRWRSGSFRPLAAL